MRIMIASPFATANEGVLGMYAEELQNALEKQGHSASVCSYGSFERALPVGVRHLVFFLRCIPRCLHADEVLALDTWSVGIPSLFAAKLARKKFGVRLGGDFLWESYVERTKEQVRLSEFYETARSLSLKERLIFSLTCFLVRNTNVLFVTTKFLARVWQKPYELDSAKIRTVENFYAQKQELRSFERRVFVSAGRSIALKNYDMLERAFARVKKKYPDVELDQRRLSPAEHHERISRAYAVIIPSISEVSSNTAIDAVAARKPFIMSSDTGTSERLGACGLFIDTRKEEELLHAIESLLDPATYERYAHEAQSFSFTHSWDDIAREIVSALEK